MKTNPELILLVGPPASGKTTWAKEYQSNYPDTLIIGRDKLREMMYGYSESTVNAHYGHERFKVREDEVTLMQHTLIRAALESGRSVVVDDTNLDIDRIKKFSRDYDRYAFRIVPMNASKEACLARNEARTRQVDSVTMGKLLDRYESISEKLPRLDRDGPTYTDQYTPDPYQVSAFMFDLDGTMANMSHRKPFGFADEEILLDTPIEPVVDLARMIGSKGFQLVFLSGRELTYYNATREWLVRHLPKGQPFCLFMRPVGDFRKDSIVKRELFMEHVAANYNVKAVFDDRKQVKQMWVDLGIFVFDVNQSDRWF